MENILATLKDMDESRRNNNTDWMVLIVGRRGTGKSNLALWCASQITTEENIRIVNTGTEFLTAVNEIPQYGVIVYDEGLRGLMGRQAMSTENIEQIKAIAQMRQNKNLIVFIITQDFQMMERHIRYTCDGLFKCIFTNGKQGVVLCYGPNTINKVKIKDGQLEYPEPDYADRFPSIADTPLWQRYELMEGQKKEESTKNGLQKIADKNKPAKTEKQIEEEIRIRDYFNQLRKRRKSFRQMETLIKKKFGKSPDHTTLLRWLKK